MKKNVLVIMAAGIGSRFGGGIKQLEPVGPSGEIIMDYSVYDAMEAGFNKVVFIIRKDLEKDFREVIGNRMEKVVETAYAFQELDDLPEGFTKPEGRTKPWGTGQAVLCCRDAVKEPFLVINADDYYGKEAYREAFRYLNQPEEPDEKLCIGMVGFVLKNTLSDNGTVTRGICKVGENRMLMKIKETYGIEKKGDRVVAGKDAKEELDSETPVSMNMWALRPEFFSVLEDRFADFLDKLPPENLSGEYLLPAIIGELLEEKKAQVKVLNSKDKWFGVTYKEDRDIVVQSIRALIKEGEYPERLFVQ